MGEELEQNDELIVSKRSADCPEDDEDDCVYDVDANKKDNLIYPMTVIATRRPRQYVFSQAPFTVEIHFEIYVN